VRRAVVVLLLAVPLLVAAGCGGSSGDAADTTAAATTQASSTTTSSSASDGCTQVAAPAPRADGGATEPKERLDPEKTYKLVFKTNCGSFTVTLDLDSAPATSASFVSLAKAGFFDNTVFHRIVPGFVIQGGDPTQTGTGGPGYKTVDPPASGAKYTEGVVAMAKTQDEPAGTSGSQFFVVTGADIGLPPDYAIVGSVTEGLDTVRAVGKLGDPTTEQPTQPVVIESVTVEEQ
jgi:peptidyl-prolyl cis-trans isomerase B (cyclophilin B)